MIKDLIAPIAGLLDKFVEDKDQRNALAHDIATMSEKLIAQQNLAQMEVNKAEASSSSMFVSGWRPAVGWCCVFAMAGNFIVTPFANFALGLAGVSITIPLVPLDTMMPVLLGILGLGGLRTYEKSIGVNRK
jgi:hypothetical protein